MKDSSQRPDFKFSEQLAYPLRDPCRPKSYPIRLPLKNPIPSHA